MADPIGFTELGDVSIGSGKRVAGQLFSHGVSIILACGRPVDRNRCQCFIAWEHPNRDGWRLLQGGDGRVFAVRNSGPTFMSRYLPKFRCDGGRQGHGCVDVRHEPTLLLVSIDHFAAPNPMVRIPSVSASL